MLAYIFSQLSVFDELQKPSAHDKEGWKADRMDAWFFSTIEKNLSNIQQSRMLALVPPDPHTYYSKNPRIRT